VTRDHFQGDLNDGADDDGTSYVPTLGDAVTRWRYTLVPTLYTNEDSTTNELLWQQVLEQRAIRAWLVVLATLGGVALPLALIVAALLLHNTAP
jgi:hypothetical protein